MNWKRQITAFLAGQTITLFGSMLVQFAITWYIARETSSGLYVTLSVLCSFGPQILLSIFSGVWADRYNKKMLIILSDGGIALATLILAILMARGASGIWLLFIFSAVRSAGSGIQMPAIQAILPQLVPKDKLMRINGITNSIHSTINLISPAAAGAVLNFGAFHYLLLIDVVTAAIGISILIGIPFLHKAKEKGAGEHAGYFDELKAGIRYSLNHSFVRKLFIFSTLFAILIAPCAILNVLMVTRTFGGDYWYLTANEIAFFAGAVIGGVLLSTWGGFRNRMDTFTLGIVVFGIFTFIMGFTYNFIVYLAVIFIIGIAMPFGNTPVTVMIQEKVEPQMMGRVFGLYSIIFSSFIPLGTLIFGPLADTMPIQWLMIASGILLTILGVVLRFIRSFYREGLPETV